jgi:peptide/nickel transport system ATP-binding protein
VAFAHTLAADADRLVCAEVASALDPLVADWVLQLLVRLQRETGIAYLFFTHDLETVRRIADRVAVMRAGAIVADGALDRVFAPPRHPYTERLLAAVPELRREWLDEALARTPAPDPQEARNP